MRLTFIFLFFISVLLSCQDASYEGFREKGRAKSRKVIAELKSIRTKDQLVENELILRQEFNELKNLIKEVAHYRAIHPEIEIPSLGAVDHEISDQLRAEIIRIQRLDGGKEILFY